MRESVQPKYIYVFPDGTNVLTYEDYGVDVLTRTLEDIVMEKQDDRRKREAAIQQVQVF